jgi:hypothetical protein
MEQRREDVMEDRKWKHAAWMAIGAAALTPGNLLLSFLADMPIRNQGVSVMIAVISIIGGVCFTLIILAPVGMLLLIAENVVLALLFLRAGESEPTVEFV